MGKIKFVHFSEARIQFMREIAKHQEIVDKIVEELDLDPATGTYDEGEVVGLVASKYKIVMNGDYDNLSLDHMYNMLIDKMRGNRIVRIIH